MTRVSTACSRRRGVHSQHAACGSGFQVRSQSSGKAAPASSTFWDAVPDFQMPLGLGSVAPWMPCFVLMSKAASSGFKPFDTVPVGFAATTAEFIAPPLRVAIGFEVSIGLPVIGSIRKTTLGSLIVPVRTFQSGIVTGSAAPMPGRKPSTIRRARARASDHTDEEETARTFASE